MSIRDALEMAFGCVCFYICKDAAVIISEQHNIIRLIKNYLAKDTLITKTCHNPVFIVSFVALFDLLGWTFLFSNTLNHIKI